MKRFVVFLLLLCGPVGADTSWVTEMTNTFEQEVLEPFCVHAENHTPPDAIASFWSLYFKHFRQYYEEAEVAQALSPRQKERFVTTFERVYRQASPQIPATLQDVIPSGDGEARVSPDGLFVLKRGVSHWGDMGRPDIYLVRSDGRVVNPSLEDCYQNADFCWSPDQQSVAIVRPSGYLDVVPIKAVPQPVSAFFRKGWEGKSLRFEGEGETARIKQWRTDDTLDFDLKTDGRWVSYRAFLKKYRVERLP
ncbi:MAG: hypothetical protein KC800_29410 [Candidatus Eremiobacteraeota bacterium]|nr:hypothetical protein [Candidatus Eremiobacteraeota bacterium]